MSQSQKKPIGPTAGGPSQVTRDELVELSERMDKVEERLERVDRSPGTPHEDYGGDNNGEAGGNYIRTVIYAEENSPYEAIFEGVVDTGIVLGALGAIAAYVSGGLGFVPLFLVGLVFLTWARIHGPPQ